MKQKNEDIKENIYIKINSDSENRFSKKLYVDKYGFYFV